MTHNPLTVTLHNRENSSVVCMCVRGTSIFFFQADAHPPAAEKWSDFVKQGRYRERNAKSWYSFICQQGGTDTEIHHTSGLLWSDCDITITADISAAETRDCLATKFNSEKVNLWSKAKMWSVDPFLLFKSMGLINSKQTTLACLFHLFRCSKPKNVRRFPHSQSCAMTPSSASQSTKTSP